MEANQRKIIEASSTSGLNRSINEWVGQGNVINHIEFSITDQFDCYRAKINYNLKQEPIDLRDAREFAGYSVDTVGGALGLTPTDMSIKEGTGTFTTDELYYLALIYKLTLVQAMDFNNGKKRSEHYIEVYNQD